MSRRINMRDKIINAATWSGRNYAHSRGREAEINIVMRDMHRVMDALLRPTPEMLAAGAAAIGTTPNGAKRIWLAFVAGMHAAPPSADAPFERLRQMEKILTLSPVS